MPARTGRHPVLLMLDEFPALGRLDFFESALAYMAGYGLQAFLIAQSLNQIDKAYGPNHAILDNCHVRVAFASNDERTAKRISDALGTATELRAQRNYAGHRLAPWLGHLMVSRQESARPLLTPGEVMQLPNSEEIVMVSGHPPIRAVKLRYYRDNNFAVRMLPSPALSDGKYIDCPRSRSDDWTSCGTLARPDGFSAVSASSSTERPGHEGGPSQEPELADLVGPVQPQLGLFEDGDPYARKRSASLTPAMPLSRVTRLAVLDPTNELTL